MKFRTDFVTNSSDTSYLAFNIKNKELFDYLSRLGIHIDTGEQGVFDDNTEFTLPSGIRVAKGDEGIGPNIDDYHSISEWLIDVFINEYIWAEEYAENDFDDEEYDEDAEYDKRREEYKAELKSIITIEERQLIRKMDSSIEYAHIEQEEGFEGELYTCKAVDVRDGIRTETIPERDFLYGLSIEEEFDFEGEPGEVSTQRWENGHWVTVE